MLNQSAFIKKGDKYQIAPNNGLTDVALLGIAQEYQARISRSFIPLHTPDIVKFTADTQTTISVKYDGEGSFIYYDEPKNLCFIFRGKGRVRIGLPCLDELAKKLKAAKVQRALIAGELYVKRDWTKSSRRTQIADVIRASFSVDPADHANLGLALYDVLMWKGKDCREDDFEQNLQLLKDTFGDNTNELTHVVEHVIVPEKDVATWFKNYVDRDNQEGIVIRNLKGVPRIFKIKPCLTVDGVILGYIEDQVGTVYGISSLLIGIWAKDHWLELCRIGSGLDPQQRVDLLDQLQKTKIDSCPVNISDSSGKLVQFVAPTTIVEVNAEALIQEEEPGVLHLTKAFKWGNNAYEFKGMTTLPRLSFPTFGRMRPDKQPTPTDTRVEQIISETFFPEGELPIKQTTVTPAKIIEILTFVKGSNAIRKLVVCQRGFERYLLWQDYSEERATPHTSEIYIAYSKERCEEIKDYILKENMYDAKGKLKRGWSFYAPIEAI